MRMFDSNKPALTHSAAQDQSSEAENTVCPTPQSAAQESIVNNLLKSKMTIVPENAEPLDEVELLTAKVSSLQVCDLKKGNDLEEVHKKLKNITLDDCRNTKDNNDFENDLDKERSNLVKVSQDSESESRGNSCYVATIEGKQTKLRSRGPMHGMPVFEPHCPEDPSLDTLFKAIQQPCKFRRPNRDPVESEDHSLQEPSLAWAQNTTMYNKLSINSLNGGTVQINTPSLTITNNFEPDDMFGFTDISQQLDSEDMQKVLDICKRVESESLSDGRTSPESNYSQVASPDSVFSAPSPPEDPDLQMYDTLCSQSKAEDLYLQSESEESGISYLTNSMSCDEFTDMIFQQMENTMPKEFWDQLKKVTETKNLNIEQQCSPQTFDFQNANFAETCPVPRQMNMTQQYQTKPEYSLSNAINPSVPATCYSFCNAPKSIDVTRPFIFGNPTVNSQVTSQQNCTFTPQTGISQPMPNPVNTQNTAAQRKSTSSSADSPSGQLKSLPHYIQNSNVNLAVNPAHTVSGSPIPGPRPHMSPNPHGLGSSPVYGSPSPDLLPQYGNACQSPYASPNPHARTSYTSPNPYCQQITQRSPQQVTRISTVPLRSPAKESQHSVITNTNTNHSCTNGAPIQISSPQHQPQYQANHQVTNIPVVTSVVPITTINQPQSVILPATVTKSNPIIFTTTTQATNMTPIIVVTMPNQQVAAQGPRQRAILPKPPEKHQDTKPVKPKAPEKLEPLAEDMMPRIHLDKQTAIKAMRWVHGLTDEKEIFVEDEDGDTLLHRCSIDKEYHCLYALLSRVQSQYPEKLKAFIDTCNNDKQTALYIATVKNCPEIVSQLVNYRADPNIQSVRTRPTGEQEYIGAIHVAARNGTGYLDTLKCLLNSPLINKDQLSSEGYTALHYAAMEHGKKDSSQTIPLLLRHGADINKQSGKKGETMLHILVETRDVVLLGKVLGMLPSAVVSHVLQVASYQANTCLHIAAQLPSMTAEDQLLQKQILELLLEYGADTSVKNSQQKLPKDLLRTQDTKLLEKLKPRGKRSYTTNSTKGKH